MTIDYDYLDELLFADYEVDDYDFDDDCDCIEHLDKQPGVKFDAVMVERDWEPSSAEASFYSLIQNENHPAGLQVTLLTPRGRQYDITLALDDIIASLDRVMDVQATVQYRARTEVA